MARIRVFEGGTVQRQGLTNAREQGADYGRSALEVGLKTAGAAVSDFAEQQDQLADIDAQIEANRLAVEHGELARGLSRNVKQAMGENAEPAANAAMVDLDKGTDEILARASPRAQLRLKATLAERSSLTKDNWLDHSFGEKKVAFDANSKARLTTIAEDANDEDDEGRAIALLGQSKQVIQERAQFFGQGEEQTKAEMFAFTSDFFKSRALKKAAGDNGSASQAIEYATANREYMTDAAYNQVLNAFDDAATDERVSAEVNGEVLPSATTGDVEEYYSDPLAPDAQPAVARRLDPHAFFKAFTVPHEGAAYVVDSNGAGVKYGINAAYNPGVDVKNLTEAQAAEIFRKKYFEKSGADKLPPALAAAHVDTFYLNEREAGRILRQSGGDVDKYIDLRNQFLNGLVAKNPAKFGKYKNGWQNRTNALAAFADRQGGDGTAAPIPVAINTSMRSVEEKVMSRTDVGLKYKRKLIAAYRDKRAGMVEERNQSESEATRAALDAALQLGDNFTSIKQLPSNVLAQLGPSGIQTFTNMAKGNVSEAESKPLSPEDAAYIAFVEVSNPRQFASEGFRQELARRGVPMGTLRSVAGRQGQVRGQLLNPKAVDPIADGRIWTIAKEPFEAAGVMLDTVEGKGKAAATERQADAQQKLQALGYLRDLTTRWMTANPGKQPSDDLIRGWVGHSLLRSNGARAFSFTPQQEYMALPAQRRVAIIRELYGNGPRPSNQQMMEDVIKVHRNNIAALGGGSAR